MVIKELLTIFYLRSHTLETLFNYRFKSKHLVVQHNGQYQIKSPLRSFHLNCISLVSHQQTYVKGLHCSIAFI